jgi:hypothetical protein
MKNIKFIVSLTSLFLAAVSMTSCNAIYDDEGDCSTAYKVKFRYDMNMKFADAFPSEVESVTLYVLDDDENVVFEKTEAGSALKEDGYAMDLDINPGKYTLLAWCTANNEDSWEINTKQRDSDRFSCTLSTMSKDGSGNAEIDYDIDALYHSRMTQVEFKDEPGVQVVTMPLTKDTNRVRIVLQNLSGEALDVNDFDFTIHADDGKLAEDNSVVKGNEVTYRPWHVSTSNIENKAREGEFINAAVAELNMSRLVTDDDPILTISKKESGDIVAQIPLRQYVLLVKGYENVEMSDQEYLDRQDEYNLIFFMDENGNWMDSYVYINSWKVVLLNPNM